MGCTPTLSLSYDAAMSYRTVDPTQGKELVEEGWTYLDVRTVEEFGAGHPPGAYNIPFAVVDPSIGRMVANPEFCDVVKKTFQPGDQLVVSCAAGGRSMHACELLVAEGYSNLVNMHGGFSGARDMSGVVLQDGWEALGYPTTDEPQADRTYDALRGA